MVVSSATLAFVSVVLNESFARWDLKLSFTKNALFACGSSPVWTDVDERNSKSFALRTINGEEQRTLFLSSLQICFDVELSEEVNENRSVDRLKIEELCCMAARKNRRDCLSENDYELDQLDWRYDRLYFVELLVQFLKWTEEVIRVHCNVNGWIHHSHVKIHQSYGGIFH